MTLLEASPVTSEIVTPDAEAPRPRILRRITPAMLLELTGSAAASFSLAWLLVYRLGPFDGVFGLLICWYLAFVPIYALVVKEAHGTLAAKDRMSSVFVTTAGVLTVAPLAFIVVYVVGKGHEAALRWNFFSKDMAATGGGDPLSSGGLVHALIGSLEQVAIALVICVPLALATAVYMNEVRGRFAKAVRFFVNSMSGTPSIVAGLFIYSALVLAFGFSGFSSALALSILMLPTVARTTEETLRLVPGGLREAALALGAPEWRVVLRVVLPTARSGIATAVILGTARIVGEAAPALLTAFGATGTNKNPFEDNQESLPTFIFSLIRQPSQNQQDRAWGGALVLLALVLLLFGIARYFGSRRPGSRRSTAVFRLARTKRSES